MIVSFDHVTPSPLDGVTDLQTEVWNQNFVMRIDQHTKIFAPSGKGKSTFMHLIYGLRRDYSGLIKIDDRPIKEFTATDWAVLRRDRLSIVFQDLRLFQDLSALENIQLKHELKPHVDFEILESYFERLNISHIKHKPCGQFSYGERQRVAIIRALVQPFEVLLLDEPFSHLDSNNAQTASLLIEEACQKRNAHYVFTSLGSDIYLNETKSYRL